ncbi:MAG: tetratricopeptide repeat protein [Phycisphaeraceae bacterium]|nr:tetratricopeptide repeat protein [Phycisphaeraceae bacterium]
MSFARAQQLVATAEFAQAESLLLRHLRASPRDPDALHLMGLVLARLGKQEQSLHYAQRATEAAPRSPNTWINLGTTLLHLRREDDALSALRRAADLDPTSPAAAHALAFALNSTQRFSEARDLCRKALQSQPNNVPLSLDLADSLQNLARADEAVELLETLATVNPGNPLIAGNLAAAMNYAYKPNAEAVFEAHRRFGQSLAAALPPSRPPTVDRGAPDRPIRLGLIIPDLIRHSVAYFARPWLERLDPGQFELFIYYTSSEKDVSPPWLTTPHTVRRIAWEPLPKLDAIVRTDRLDMLMDLCGMSTQHRLQLMHLKPAPIQLTYAGYPNTTGIAAIDGRIVDSITDPPGAEHLATERLIRFDPCFLCYRPPDDAPALSTAQSACHQPDRPLTFASFNHLPKINDAVIEVWSRIMHETPPSRLVLKATGLRHPETREELTRRLTDAGIPADRLRVLPPTASRAEHLRLYDEVDIALDTFPYNGTTTTCEALFMGVPVVALTGQSHVSRVGSSLLNGAGLGHLVAQSPDQYVSIAVSLANTRPSRADVRQRFSASPICDHVTFGKRFQSMLLSIYQQLAASR